MISVVLATYNDEKYIKEAIDSVLDQTYRDFELIIIDDGSSDRTADIICSYDDKRIIFIQNERNMGLPYSLNKGMEIAKGEYIARMDGDDICFPQRFQKQLEYMEQHSDITICGTNRLDVSENGKKSSKRFFPEESEALKARLLFGNPIAHSSWFIRKEDFLKYHFKYNEDFRYSQDYELIYRVLKSCKIACVQTVLMKYRVNEKTKTNGTRRDLKYTIKVFRQIMRELGMFVSAQDFKLIFGCESDYAGFSGMKRMTFLFREIIRRNRRYRIFEQDILKHTLKQTAQGRCRENRYQLYICWYMISPFEILWALIRNWKKTVQAE